MRQHKSSTTINSSGNDQRLDQESFQRRWSFRLPHSSSSLSSPSSFSSSSWTALKIPDYFKESSKTEVEKDRAKVAESPVSSPVSLKRFVSHSDLTQVSNKPRYGSLSTFPSTHSSSTSSIPAKVNLILISRISWQGQVNTQVSYIFASLSQYLSWDEGNVPFVVLTIWHGDRWTVRSHPNLPILAMSAYWRLRAGEKSPPTTVWSSWTIWGRKRYLEDMHRASCVETYLHFLLYISTVSCTV